MSSFWQEGSILILVGGAVAYLARRIILWRRRRKCCSECQLVKGVSKPLVKQPANHSTN